VRELVVLLVQLLPMTKKELYDSICIATKIESNGKTYYADEYGLFHLEGDHTQLTLFSLADSKLLVGRIFSPKVLQRLKSGDFRFFVKRRLRMKKRLMRKLINDSRGFATHGPRERGISLPLPSLPPKGGNNGIT